MKAASLIAAALILAAPAYAAEKSKKMDTNDKIREAKKKDLEAVKDFMEPKDKNKDGSLSKDEFISDESDKDAAGKKFDEANKNKDRSLSKSEISEMLGLGGEVEKLKQAEKDSKKKK